MIDSENSMKIISDLGEISLSIVNLSSLSKELNLYFSNIHLNRTLDIIQSDIRTQASSLHSNYKHLLQDLQDNSKEDWLKSYHIPYWQYSQSSSSETYPNVLDYTTKITNLAISLTNSTSLSQDSPSLLELYRNTHPSILSTFNTTAFDLISDVNIANQNRFSLIIYLSSASQIVMCVSIGLLAIIPLWKLAKFRAKLWRGILDIPTKVLEEGINKVKGRLSLVHHETSVNPKAQDKEKKSRYRKHRLQIVSLGFVGILGAGISGYLWSVDYKQLPDVLSLLEENVKVSTWVMIKMQTMTELVFLLRENAFGTRLGLSNIAGYDGFTETHTAIDKLLYANSRSIKNAELSNKLWDLYYETSADFKYGYHAYTIDLINRISNNNQLLHQNYSFFDIQSIQLETDIRNYLIATKDLLSILKQEYDQERSKNFDLFLCYTLVAMMSVVLYICIGVYTIVNKLRDLLLKESTIMIVLPKTSSHYILQTYRKILNT